MRWAEVCLNFESRELYHCCFYTADFKYHKLNVGVIRIWKYQPISHMSAGNSSWCELSLGSLWWLSEVCDCRPWKRRLLSLKRAEDTRSFHGFWRTSVIFRRWSVLLVLLSWSPSNFRALNLWSFACVNLEILNFFASENEKPYCYRPCLLRFTPLLKHRIVIQDGKEAQSKVRSLVISYAAVTEGILMKIMWFEELVMN